MGMTYAGIEYYRDELLRRETARGTNLTPRLWYLTLVVVLAAILALAISVAALLKVGA